MDPQWSHMKAAAAAAMLVVAFALCFTLAGCPRPLPPPTPPTDADAGAATCTDWCAHAAALGCEAGKPTPNGATCVEVCANTIESGLVHWELSCLARAPTCAAANGCSR